MEQWRHVKINGQDTPYMVSNMGEIKNKHDKMMKQHKDKGGYCKIGLYINKKTKQSFVHRLVALAFLGDCFNKVIHHKNGICDDNRLENLEITTQKRNVQYSYSNTTRKNSSRQVEQYDYDENLIQEYISIGEAGKSVKIKFAGDISRVCNGKRLSAGGYVWKWSNLN